MLTNFIILLELSFFLSYTIVPGVKLQMTYVGILTLLEKLWSSTGPNNSGVLTLLRILSNWL